MESRTVFPAPELPATQGLEPAAAYARHAGGRGADLQADPATLSGLDHARSEAAVGGHPVRAGRRERNRMSPNLRRGVYSLTGLMFTTGVSWFLLDRYGQVEGTFGPMKHPWQHPLLVAHGVAATGYLLVLGNVLAQHVKRGWSMRGQRLQGAMLLLVQLLLVLTAPALYYVGEPALRGAISNVHLLAGLGLIVALPLHLWLGTLDKRKAPASKLAGATAS